MSEDKVLLLYSELSVLKVCIPPEEPFFSIPMVVARKEGKAMVFGFKALAKDESWQLTWLQGGKAQRGLISPLFRFVYRHPIVQKHIPQCRYLLVAFPFVLSQRGEHNGESFEYDTVPAYGFPFRLIPSSHPEDDLCLFARAGWGTCYSLNISGDFTSLRSMNSYPLPTSTFIKVGFDTIVNLFIKLLCEKGYDFTAPRDRLFCQDLVMDYCYLALDFEKELERIENLDKPLYEITLEDGTVLELGKECIMAPEVLFNPALVGIDGEGIKIFLENELLLRLDHVPTVRFAGGCAPRLKGLEKRILHELGTMDKNLFQNRVKIVRTNRMEDVTRWYSRLS